MVEEGRQRASVLMVCTGNICRSPAAERLARHHWGRTGDITISSAGTGALVGEPINLTMRHLLLLDAVDTDDFAARTLTEPQLRGADLVLGMTARHRHKAVALHPAGLRTTFTLLEFARLAAAVAPHLQSTGRAGRLLEIIRRVPEVRGVARVDTDDIVDPYGQSTEVYDLSYATIRDAILAVSRVLRGG